MTTLERLRAILVRTTSSTPEKSRSRRRSKSLGIDSLGVAELLFNVEDEFGITLPPEPVQLPTIGDVVAYIDGSRVRSRSAALPASAEPAAESAPRPS